MKVVETFEVVRKFLGWSYQEVSVKSGKYSPEYLKQVHQGRPFSGVEKDLTMTYMYGLAVRAVDIVFLGQVQGSLRDKLVTKFTQAVRQRKLLLEDVQTLVERISMEQVSGAGVKYRAGTMDAVGVEIAWEGVLETIIRDLDELEQGTLFESDGENTVQGTHSLRVSGETLPSYQSMQVPQVQTVVECPRCRKIQTEAEGAQCTGCGNGSVFNPNW